jgi:hypothetical protein
MDSSCSVCYSYWAIPVGRNNPAPSPQTLHEQSAILHIHCRLRMVYCDGNQLESYLATSIVLSVVLHCTGSMLLQYQLSVLYAHSVGSSVNTLLCYMLYLLRSIVHILITVEILFCCIVIVLAQYVLTVYATATCSLTVAESVLFLRMLTLVVRVYGNESCP